MLEHHENEFALNLALNLVQDDEILLTVCGPADKLTEQLNGARAGLGSGNRIVSQRQISAEGAASEYCGPFPPLQSGDRESSPPVELVRVIRNAAMSEPPYVGSYGEGS